MVCNKKKKKMVFIKRKYVVFSRATILSFHHVVGQTESLTLVQQPVYKKEKSEL